MNTAPKFNRPFDSQDSFRNGKKEDAYASFIERKKQLLERDTSKINNLFQCMIGDKIICLQCQRPKMNFNTEYILSIPLLKDQNSRRDFNKSVAEGMR